MSFIAVEGLSIKITLDKVVNMLANSIHSDFKVINFLNSDCGIFKTCYLQISENVDPVEVVERINNIVRGKKENVLNAFIPDTVPNLPVPAKPLFLRKKLRKKLGIGAGELTHAQVLSIAHMEIMTELQYKYTGLCTLSSKGSHALLAAIGTTIYDRLERLLTSGDEDESNPFLLTGRYRKVHPHFGDFQLILDTLHRLEDAVGARHTVLQETDLIATPKDMSRRIANIGRCAKDQEAIGKYTARIINKLEQYVSTYDLKVNPEDNKEEVARKQVQTQLAKIVPHMPTISKELMMNHVTQDNSNNRFQKMRMYGEPSLPAEEVTLPLLKRYNAQRISRRKTMYNLVVFDVPLNSYSRILEVDGIYLGGSKIVMRSSDVNLYRVPLPKKDAVMESTVKADYKESDCNIEQ